jgi:hypothetical protein
VIWRPDFHGKRKEQRGVVRQMEMGAGFGLMPFAYTGTMQPALLC